MREFGRGRLRRGVFGFVTFLGIGGLAASPALPRAAAAQSGEEGAVCVQDFSQNTSCTASDVVATGLALVDVIESCPAGDPTTAQVVVELTLAAGSSDRYDPAIFIALEGGSALNGSLCFHDYLEPPLDTNPVYGDSNGNAVSDLHDGPWANLEPFASPSDDCGDIAANTEAIKSLASPSVPLVIDCVDSNEDGTVDVDVCIGWRNGSSGAQSCRRLGDAIAESSNRCSCTRLEITGLPEPGIAPALAAGSLALGALARFRRRAGERGGARRRPGLRRGAIPEGAGR